MAAYLKPIAAVWGVLVTVRFSLLFTLVVLAVLMAASQAKDLLWLTAEKGWGWSRALSLYVAALIYAVNAWYWARIALYARNAGPDDLTPFARRLESGLPRFLGAAPFAALAYAIWNAAGTRITENMAPETLHRLDSMAVFSLLLGMAFFGFTVIRRRQFLNRDWQEERTIQVAQAGLPADSRVLPWSRLPALTRKLIKAFLPVFAVVVAVTALMPVEFGRFWGMAPLLLVWGAGFVAIGSAVSYFSSLTRLPLLLGPLALAFLFGGMSWNANHQLRMTTEPQGPAPVPVDTAFQRWFEVRAAEIAASPEPYPVVIVASAGGGIRAAYWTSYVLARLEDARPGFSRHVLAMSGVSGGSVGISAFAADVKLGRTSQDSATRRALDYYEAEFLSPLMTGFLIPDLAQRFLPLPVMWGGNPLLDRARGFELGLESSPGAIAGPMGTTVAGLYEGGATDVPFLFLNTTTVQTGAHAVISPVRLDLGAFNQVTDLSCISQRVRVSTAAHTSARFPYLSPAGELEWEDAAGCEPAPGKDYDYLYVDGGYFDNSGTVTARGIGIAAGRAFAAVRDRIAPSASIRLVFVYLANDPEMPTIEAGNSWPAQPDTPPSTALQDLTAPVVTILNVRSAVQLEMLDQFVEDVERGKLNRDADHESDVSGMSFHLMRLPASVPDVPLGWVLSDLSKEEIRQSVDGCPGAAPPADVKASAAGHIMPDDVTCESWSALMQMLPVR